VKNFVAFYGSPSYITAFTEARAIPHIGIQINPILALQTDVLSVKKTQFCPADLKFHNEDLSDLYSSPNIVRVIKSRRMRWAGHVARMGEERGAYRVLVGKSEGKRPLGRPRRRWVDNVRMDLQEVECGYVDWIGLAQDRERWRTLVSAVMSLRVP